jgi:hypothetical protein
MPQWHALASGKHAQLMAQDEDLDLTRGGIIRLAASGKETQQAAHGEVD